MKIGDVVLYKGRACNILKVMRKAIKIAYNRGLQKSIYVSKKKVIPYLLIGDCLNRFQEIPNNSIDMILCDPPYGTTQCKWDSIIPLNKYIVYNNRIFHKDEYIKHMSESGCVNDSYEYLSQSFDKSCKLGIWDHINRIVKNTAPIIFTAAQPFTTTLISSNIGNFKYCWVWEKPQATGYLNAKKRPLVAHEDIVVFYKKQCVFNRQKTYGHKPVNTFTKLACVQNKTQIYGKVSKDISGGGSTERVPRSVIIFSSDKQKTKLDSTVYPTQKPVALMEYFIKTYSNKGDKILDFTMGSGTSIIAAKNLGRKAIGIEKGQEGFDLTKRRLNLF